MLFAYLLRLEETVLCWKPYPICITSVWIRC